MEKVELNPNPMDGAGYLSKLTFMWLLPLFKKGFKKPLEKEDLFQVRRKQSAEILGNLLCKNWNQEASMALASGRKPKFTSALFKSFGLRFCLLGIAKGMDRCFVRIMQGLLLGGLIKYFNKDPQFSADYVGLLLASGIVLSAVIKMALLTGSEWGLQNLGMEMRIATCNLLYQKAILITAILWQILGPSSFVAVIFPFLNIPMQGFMSKVYSRLCLATANLTDERIGTTNEVMNIMRFIKIYCWEGLFDTMVKKLRRREVTKLLRTNYYISFNWALYFVSGKIILFFTLLVYIFLGNSITAEKVFITMILVEYLNDTTTYLVPLAITNLTETLISCGRIQNSSVIANDVSARWNPASGCDDLTGISFKAVAGQLLAVVGSVGSGKSSLLHTLIGELPIKAGSIKIEGKIAYVSQEPWLFSGTIKQNILFGQPFHFRKYRKVIKECALEKDLELFPDKDQTIVGEKGDSLSGGQKARICLARAVYFDADIYLLDDPLSAVDAHVGRQLFHQCILKFLSKKVCILVTHQLQYLKAASQILVLQNGVVQSLGTPDSLPKQGINIENLEGIKEEEEEEDVVTELRPNRAKSCWETPDENVICSKLTRFRRDSQAWQSFTGSNEHYEEFIGESIQEISSGASGRRRMTLMEDYELEEIVEVKKAKRDEAQATGKLDKSIYIKYFKAGGGTLFLTVLAALFLVKHVIFVGIDYWLAYWLRKERDSGKVLHSPFRRENNSFSNMTLLESVIKDERELYLYIYTGLVAALIFVTFFQSVLYARLCAATSEKLHLKMFSAVLATNMNFFDIHSVGQILNRFSNDLGKIDTQLPTSMYDLIMTMLFCSGSLGVVASMNYWILILVIVIIVSLWFLRLVYLSSAREIRRLEAVMRSPVFSHLGSSLQGLATIRSFVAQKQLIREFETHLDMHTSVWFQFLATTTCFCIWLDVLSVVFIAVTTFSFFGMKGEISGNDVGLSISNAFFFAVIFAWGVRQSVDVENNIISVERVTEYTKLESENLNKGKNEINKFEWPNAGNISFQNVYLYYDKKEAPVLKNVTFNIKGGLKVGIVGRTGAGKSTLLTCLMRLTQPEGKIIIDNVNTDTINLNDLRESISIIPQHPILFKGTIRQNLDPFSNYSDDELWNALDEVELKHLTIKMPDGLSSLVTQGGENFSIGQRQLFCLARAILKHNIILVMDEATANVDPQTDSKIQKIIRLKFADCTVLTIAHRINTIIDSDKVIVMDAGEVKEFSSPYELLQDNRSIFSELIRGTDPENEKALRKSAKEAYFLQLADR